MTIDKFEQALSLLSQAKRPVAFAGAGMSADSGIPTFRGSDGGLWSEYDPTELATPGAYRADKALVWGWYVWRMANVQRANPHAGHLALAEMQCYWPEFTVITQNVDDLHERAGSRNVIHLHGGLFAHRCACCGTAFTDFKIPDDAIEHPLQRRKPPICRRCGGYVRPGVVWFGEDLPVGAWGNAVRQISLADVVLVIGTSGVVEPAASLVSIAKKAEARIIEINTELSLQSWSADVSLFSGAAKSLGQLASGLKNRLEIS